MRQSIYGGLLISLLGIAVLVAMSWLFVFPLAGKVMGLICGATLVYLGWRVSERGG